MIGGPDAEDSQSGAGGRIMQDTDDPVPAGRRARTPESFEGSWREFFVRLGDGTLPLVEAADRAQENPAEVNEFRSE